VVLSSLTEVEERSLALEVRAFGRPGRRHLLWRLPDTSLQLAVRVLLVAGLLVAVVLRLTGTFPALP
jgi:energy-coupling factor transport system permease protein